MMLTTRRFTWIVSVISVKLCSERACQITAAADYSTEDTSWSTERDYSAEERRYRRFNFPAPAMSCDFMENMCRNWTLQTILPDSSVNVVFREHDHGSAKWKPFEEGINISIPRPPGALANRKYFAAYRAANNSGGFASWSITTALKIPDQPYHCSKAALNFGLLLCSAGKTRVTVTSLSFDFRKPGDPTGPYHELVNVYDSQNLTHCAWRRKIAYFDLRGASRLVFSMMSTNSIFAAALDDIHVRLPGEGHSGSVECDLPEQLEHTEPFDCNFGRKSGEAHPFCGWMVSPPQAARISQPRLWTSSDTFWNISQPVMMIEMSSRQPEKVVLQRFMPYSSCNAESIQVRLAVMQAIPSQGGQVTVKVKRDTPGGHNRLVRLRHHLGAAYGAWETLSFSLDGACSLTPRLCSISVNLSPGSDVRDTWLLIDNITLQERTEPSDRRSGVTVEDLSCDFGWSLCKGWSSTTSDPSRLKWTDCSYTQQDNRFPGYGTVWRAGHQFNVSETFATCDSPFSITSDDKLHPGQVVDACLTSPFTGVAGLDRVFYRLSFRTFASGFYHFQAGSVHVAVESQGQDGSVYHTATVSLQSVEKEDWVEGATATEHLGYVCVVASSRLVMRFSLNRNDTVRIGNISTTILNDPSGVEYRKDKRRPGARCKIVFPDISCYTHGRKGGLVPAQDVIALSCPPPPPKSGITEELMYTIVGTMATVAAVSIIGGAFHFRRKRAKLLVNVQNSMVRSLIPKEIRNEYIITRNRVSLDSMSGSRVRSDDASAKGPVFAGATEVAVKVHHVMPQNHEAFVDHLAEITMLIRINRRHENVVNLIGIILSKQLLSVLEFCKHGSLDVYLRRHAVDFHEVKERIIVEADHAESRDTFVDLGRTAQNETKLELADLWHFAADVTRGMDFLTSEGIVHGDLAARNVLLDSNRVAKIADFGMALDENRTAKGRSKERLPVRWLAPERFPEKNVLGAVPSVSSDIWSFGITLWEIFALADIPYNDVYPTLDKLELILKFAAYLRASGHPAQPPLCPNAAYDLMKRCWTLHSSLRPPFTEIRKELEELVPRKEQGGYICFAHSPSTDVT